MPRTFGEYLFEFLEYLKVNRNYSLHTLISYKTDLIQFGDYILKSERGIKSGSSDDISNKIIDFSTIELNFLKSYIAEISDPKSTHKIYSRKSVSRKISVLKSFYKFLIKKKYIY